MQEKLYSSELAWDGCLTDKESVEIILAEFRIDKESQTDVVARALWCSHDKPLHLLSFWKLSYWSLLYPRRWRCWTSASGRSIPASRLVLLSFYPDQQELKSPKDEETAQEYLMRMMLAPPFGYRDELKLECSKALINPQDILIVVVRRWRVYVFYMKFSLSKKKKKGRFLFFHAEMAMVFL